MKSAWLILYPVVTASALKDLFQFFEQVLYLFISCPIFTKLVWMPLDGASGPTYELKRLSCLLNLGHAFQMLEVLLRFLKQVKVFRAGGL